MVEVIILGSFGIDFFDLGSSGVEEGEKYCVIIEVVIL